MPAPEVTVTGRGSYGPGNTRYRLSNGWFIDREQATARRHFGQLYTLWEPGAAKPFGAAYRGGGRRLADVLAQLNANRKEPDMPKLAEGRPLSDAALAALRGATVNGGGDHHAVTLHAQLDRDDYLQVNAVLERLGGKWNRGKRVHLFPPDRNPSAQLAAIVDAQVLPPDPKRRDGWFATPRLIASDVAYNRCLIHVDKQVHELRILEPSAGEGALADALVDHGADPERIQCIEPDPYRAAILRAKGYPTHELRFQDWAIRNQGEPGFDVILMNPPFAEPGDRRAWITHVTLAYSLLVPGGQLTAIVPNALAFGTDRATTALRELVQTHGGEWHELPEQAFKESGTGVRALVASVQRPAEEADRAPSAPAGQQVDAAPPKQTRREVRPASSKPTRPRAADKRTRKEQATKMPTTTVEAPATAPAPKPAASACACGGTVTGYRKHLAAKTTVCDAAKQAVSDYRRGLRERAGQSAPAVRTAKELEADVAAQVAEQTAPKETARDVAERAYARVKADDAKGKGKAAKMGTGPGSRAPDRFADKGGRPAGVKAKATPKPEPVAPAVEAVPGAVLVDARALKDALAPYKQVVAKRATLPVLGGVRLVAVNGAHGPQGHLFIQGTNLEATLETRIPAVTGEAELEAVVPFGALLDAASAAVPKSRNQQASVELRPEPDAHLAVSCGPMRQRLSLLPAEDFPRMMPKLDARGRDVDGATLAKAIAAVHVAISDDQARPILNAALLELGPRQVTLAATDSYRLAVRHVANQASRAYAKEERATLVQREALALAGKLFAKSPRVTLRWSRDLFAFSDERRALLVRPVEGDFPRFRDLIPNPAAKPEAGQSAYGRLEVDRQQLLDALDAFPRSMQQNRNPVHLLLRADTLELSGSEQDVATTSMTLPATWTGEPGIRAGFNPGFLRDGVAGFAEQVNIWIRDGLKPALLTPVVPTIDPRDTDLYLLMPVRLPDPAPEPQPKLEPAPGAEAKAASD